MSKIKVAINGFGRIGRLSFKVLLQKEEVEVVAINDLTDNKTLAHLLKYDSSYGKLDLDITYDQNYLYADDRKIKFFNENNPSLIPWDKELVFNSIKKTGKVLLLGEDTIFNSYIGEISAVISEEIFEYLDAPVIRVGSLDTPVPFAKNLEEGFQASYKLKDKLDYLLNY